MRQMPVDECLDLMTESPNFEWPAFSPDDAALRPAAQRPHRAAADWGNRDGSPDREGTTDFGFKLKNPLERFCRWPV